MSERLGLTRVVMRLGRNPAAGFPDGDDHHGYVLVAPLNRDGMLDPELWDKHKKACTVRRFQALEPAAEGWLRHRGGQWFFWYDDDWEGPAEPVFKLGNHRLVFGEYVTVKEGDMSPLTFRVTELAEV